MTNTQTHEDVEEVVQSGVDWPQYFVCGEDVEDFPTSYYRVEAPNGPAAAITPDGQAYPITMYHVIMESQSGTLRSASEEEIPEISIDLRTSTSESIH